MWNRGVLGSSTERREAVPRSMTPGGDARRLEGKVNDQLPWQSITDL